MHTNFKLNRAVLIALGVLALSAQQPAFSLGLGDIEMKSYIGEPLKAKIQVLGAGDIKDSDCFRLAPSDGRTEDVGQVQFKLSAVQNDLATLSLTGSNPINEPILNLKVMADCGATVEREYVLLVDPAYSTAEEVGNNTEEQTATTLPAVTLKKTKSQDNQTSAQTTSTKNKKNNSKKNNKLSQNLTADSSSPSSTSKLEGDGKNNSNQPRLSISGSTAAGEIDADLPKMSALRMDRQLNLDLAALNAPAQVNDVQDEVTAMNNRLAHLQEQVNTLQQRNSQLTNENQIKTQKLNEIMAEKDQSSWLDRFSSWLIPALGIGAITAGCYYAFYWLRRRQTIKLEQETEAIWENLGKPNDEFKALVEEDIFSDMPAAKINANVENLTSMQKSFESTKELEPQILVEEDNQELSVLDHADVFLSHGRASLAIQLLQNHLLDFPKQSVTIWLFLLDLLAKENLETLYKETTLECKKYFNVKISEFAALEKDENESLDSFPRLTEGLQAVWNTSASITYLNDLIYNTRSEPRSGLSRSLLEELIMLKAIAQENLNSAEVIQLDEKKLAIKEQKLALQKNTAATKSEALDGPVLFDSADSSDKHDEKVFEFNLVDYK